ncbi:protein CIA1-like isoform X2 [Primulina huaijiensis]|uniref:protein CIA1-like isoform X2 n=1 Tax=Primulina huaijiensis TaxID=1492673 RepID=UPI003CC706A9
MNFTDRIFELKEVETLRGHTDRVCCIAWNPATGVDGVPAMIASCGADKNVLIWEQNIATGSFQSKEKLAKLHASTVIRCAWAASGSLLVTSSVRGCICIWKSFEGRFRIMNCFGRRDKLPVSVSLNASGELMASCVPQKKIWIWKRASTLNNDVKYLSTVAGSTGCTKMILWHPLKDILFSCGFDNTIKIWVPDADMVNWDCMQTLGESNRHSIWALVFNGGGNKIVACSDDLSINIWSVDTGMMRFGERNAPGTHLCTLTGCHDQTIFAVHWSRQEIICTGAADGALCFIIESEDGSFDEPAYKLLLKKDHAHDKDINSVQWCSQDNSHVASASDDGTIKIWELASLPRF